MNTFRNYEMTRNFGLGYVYTAGTVTTEKASQQPRCFLFLSKWEGRNGIGGPGMPT